MKDPHFLPNIIKQFQYYKKLGESTFDQVADDQLFWQYNDDSNSIAIIAKHIAGNAISRWTDFRNSDGEKEWRNRDDEFEMAFTNREEIIDYWNKGWSALFDALEPLNNHDLETIVYIRNQGHTVIEAINRQLAHYAYHVGQVVYIGKMIKGSEWQSLSIPKGESQVYSKEKFNQEKDRGHFTDEYIK